MEKVILFKKVNVLFEEFDYILIDYGLEIYDTYGTYKVYDSQLDEFIFNQSGDLYEVLTYLHNYIKEDIENRTAMDEAMKIHIQNDLLYLGKIKEYIEKNLKRKKV